MLLKGNCLEQLRTLADNSVDSVVTDPPYELGFMGKSWDASGIAYNTEVWRECLRVLKPGGHLLAFGGSRTYHRIAVAIEDAGFEIRDSIHWTYGSGFPKSLDISKAIDKQRDDRAEVLEVTSWLKSARDEAGKTNADIDGAFGFAGMARHWTSTKSQPAVPTLEQVPTILNTLGLTLDDVPERIRELIWTLNGNKGQPGKAWFEREVVGSRDVPEGHAFAGPTYGGDSSSKEVDITAPATEAAQQWQGWGTALKPSHEPIVVARKPLEGTVANNVLTYGTGALNIDGTRVGTSETITNHSRSAEAAVSKGKYGDSTAQETHQTEGQALGRWPANTIITHSPDCEQECAEGCPARELDEPARFFTQTTYTEADYPVFLYYAKAGKKERNAGLEGFEERREADRTKTDGLGGANPRNRSNTMKQNHHPTVKPVELMRHLIRLVTPPDGVVLDPFLGSGTTAVAAVLEGKQWIGCELTEDYWPIIEARVTWAEGEKNSRLL